MQAPQLMILYVDNPTASAEFYVNLLDQAPVEASTNFVLFVLNNGLQLGLWSKHTVEPKTAITGGGSELAFAVEDKQAVKQAHQRLSAQGLTILQQPTQMDFGYTFVALDLDGHRLRIFTPTE